MPIRIRGTAALLVTASLLSVPVFGAQAASPAPERSFPAPHGLTIKVRQVTPGSVAGSLQIICYLKHKPGGDKVLEALVDFDKSMGGLVQALRDRGEFSGEERETLWFIPPPGSLKAKSVLLMGLGDEDQLSLAVLGRIGTAAVREAVRLQAESVAYAPGIKDQGVDKLDAGDVAGAVVQSILLAYDTEKRLQAQGRSPRFSIREWICQAGPAYFQSTATHVEAAIAKANQLIAARNSSPYSSLPQSGSSADPSSGAAK